jgi:chromosome segregation ATPase
MLAASTAMSPTMVAGAQPPGLATGQLGVVTDGGTAPARRSWLGWAGGSIAYIYVYLRGKLDAGERRRRLIEERDGAQTMLTGTVRDLGAGVLREGIRHPDLSGLLEAIAREETRRASAIADIGASEKQKETEETRLTGREATQEADWKASDRAARDAEEMLRSVSDDAEEVASRLYRLRDERARLRRDAEGAAASPDGKARAASLRHAEEALAAQQPALEEQNARLEQQLGELREKAKSLRAAGTAARSKLDQAVAARRQAASAMAASIAGHARDRAEAEHAIAELTEQLGRAAAETRPPAEPLLTIYVRIDRLQDTIATRTIQVAELEKASALYDQRKLLTGVGLLTSMLLATAAALWAVLK